ncbi:MAG: 3-phosphoglycerate dehydrogenase [Oscillospiraceae bacterium]|jgi:D-3-phosphoglycerate dehydrogenase|nr:3-phosphoglycerate dehydrogenase [Oscillospiraceae bacterium]
MYTIKTLNEISPLGLNSLDKSLFSVSPDFEDPDAIIVRSAKITPDMLNPKLKCIARAGAGYNNICVEECTKRGIAVFNTPGANANAVKELAVCSLILASRNVIAANSWLRENSANPDVAAAAEKGKSQFAGNEIKGKTLGIIGYGAVGKLVGAAAEALGMNVLSYDKYAPCNSSEEEIFARSDYIALHALLTEETRGKVNSATIAQMKDGVRIINLARAELVNDDDIIAALASGKVACYVTDLPNNKTANVPGIIAIPHLGASTAESEENCALMACGSVAAFLTNGDTTHMVN